MEPLISIVIPAYNAERFIAETVQSVFRQGYSNIEIIVVDDGSTDGTVRALQPFGDTVTIISQENKGQAIARNVGIRAAHGSIIGLLDADDIWPDDHISTMLPYLVGEHACDYVRGLVRYVQDTGNGLVKTTENLLLEPLVGACLYKKSVFDTVGLFDEDMHQGEDFDWNIRLHESGLREERLAFTALLYRRHDQNLTNSQEFVKLGQVHAFRNKLARARKKNQHGANTTEQS